MLDRALWSTGRIKVHAVADLVWRSAIFRSGRLFSPSPVRIGDFEQGSHDSTEANTPPRSIPFT